MTVCKRALRPAFEGAEGVGEARFELSSHRNSPKNLPRKFFCYCERLPTPVEGVAENAKRLERGEGFPLCTFRFPLSSFRSLQLLDVPAFFDEVAAEVLVEDFFCFGCLEGFYDFFVDFDFCWVAQVFAAGCDEVPVLFFID